MNLDELVYQEQTSLRISTAAYTAVYHLEGCGLAGLWDRDGKDWITYRPSGGEYGHYRGIPNMGLNSFGHPGYAFGATTTIMTATDKHLQLESTSADGAWRTRWDFHPDHADHQVLAAATNYWWLYEGTPGGYFRPGVQYMLLPDGSRHPCNTRYAASVSDARTVMFVDPETQRGLEIAAHTPESTRDLYWPMGGEGGMTVWGFGRYDDEAGVHPLLQQVPAWFSFRFVETVNTA